MSLEKWTRHIAVIRNRYVPPFFFFPSRICGCRFFEIRKILSGLCQIQINAVSHNVLPCDAGEIAACTVCFASFNVTWRCLCGNTHHFQFPRPELNGIRGLDCVTLPLLNISSEISETREQRSAPLSLA